jgi:hypothetical protein
MAVEVNFTGLQDLFSHARIRHKISSRQSSKKLAQLVIPSLVPGIQGRKRMSLPPWIAGTGPAMTGVLACFEIREKLFSLLSPSPLARG